MAKFIIEVDDDFIREQANPETAKRKINPEASGADVLTAMYQMVVFGAIRRLIDDGVTEFRVARDMMADDTKRSFFDHNVTDVLALAHLAYPDEKKENEEHDK